jgi:hypothetical protein
LYNGNENGISAVYGNELSIEMRGYNQIMSASFVPLIFEVPELLETSQFRLRMLCASDVDKDYDAVMTSVHHLRGVFGENSDWPSPDLTREQNLVDLAWHDNEFHNRSSFTYTVMNRDESICLGCLYIFPSKCKDFEADVHMWVRKSAYDAGLDPVLFAAVKTWIADKWPFSTVRYPGRE